MNRVRRIFALALLLILICSQAFACPGGVKKVVEVINPRTRSVTLYDIGEQFSVAEIKITCSSKSEGDDILYLECKDSSGNVAGFVSHDLKEGPENAAVNTGFFISKAFEGAPYSFKITCEPPEDVKVKRERDIERSRDRNRNKLFDLLSSQDSSKESN